jgi:hypothetical protein
MSALISILTTVLPLILKYIIPLISAWMAARGHQTLSLNPDALGSQYQQLYGAWAAIAAASAGSGAGIDWWKRSTANSSIDWSKVVAGVAANGGINLIKAIALVARVFQLVSQDPEAKKLFSEAFGVQASSMPHDGNQLASLALVRTN